MENPENILQSYNWSNARVDYENGDRPKLISQRFEFSERTVQLHARNEGWIFNKNNLDKIVKKEDRRKKKKEKQDMIKSHKRMEVELADLREKLENSVTKSTKISKKITKKRTKMTPLEKAKGIIEREEVKQEIMKKRQKEIEDAENDILDIPTEVTNLTKKFPLFARPAAKVMIADYFNEPTVAKWKGLIATMKDLDILNDLGNVSNNPAEMAYIRPNNLADIQNLVIHILNEYQIIFIEGARRTRKTSTVWRWAFEYARELYFKGHKFTKTLYLASQGPVAEAIHQDMVNDKYLEDIRAHIKDHSARKSLFHFGYKFEVRNTVDRDVKGTNTFVLLIDETDKVYIENPKVIADAVPTALTHDLKLVFMANRPEGGDLAAFRRFTNMFRNKRFWMKEMGLSEKDAEAVLGTMYYITMEQSDLPEMQTPEFSKKRSIVEGIQTICVNKEYAMSQMGNKDPESGMSFSQKFIEKAVETYDQFIIEDLAGRTPYKKVLGIDTSGGEHPTGLSVWGDYHGTFYELGSHQIEGSANLDIDFVYQTALEWSIEYDVDIVVIESNSGGKRLKVWLDKRLRSTVKVMNQNIEGDETGRGPTDFMNVFRKYLNDSRIKIKTGMMEAQLGSYSPHTSKDTKHKGDIADAGLHAVWRLDIERVRNGGGNDGRKKRSVGLF